MKTMHATIRIALASMLLSTLVCAGCGGEDWESKLKGYVEDSLVGALKTAPAQEAVGILCRRGDLDQKVFSVRSFEGRLCDKKYVKGLDILGGAAVFLCWDGNKDAFRSSSCAKKALAQWGLTPSSYTPEKLLEAMKPVLLQYIKETEDAAGGAVPYYPQVKFITCLFDSSLYGPGAELHQLLCD